jgi:hypothetical protein
LESYEVKTQWDGNHSDLAAMVKEMVASDLIMKDWIVSINGYGFTDSSNCIKP